jgi:hypothetical protein
VHNGVAQITGELFDLAASAPPKADSLQSQLQKNEAETAEVLAAAENLNK